MKLINCYDVSISSEMAQISAALMLPSTIYMSFAHSLCIRGDSLVGRGPLIISFLQSALIKSGFEVCLSFFCTQQASTRKLYKYFIVCFQLLSSISHSQLYLLLFFM